MFLQNALLLYFVGFDANLFAYTHNGSNYSRPRSCEIQNGTSERNDTEIDQSDGKSYEKQEDESDEDSYVDILGESEMEIESRDIHISRQRRAEDEHEEGETGEQEETTEHELRLSVVN